MTIHAARPYQGEMEQGIYARWQSGQRNVLGVLPTGGGKTFIFSRVMSGYQGAQCAVAHRSELVGQISLALAREGVRHRIIGQASVARAASAAHMEELRADYVQPNSRIAVASVDTLVRMPANDPWFGQVGLWVMDEAHHVLRENKWGRACALFPNARGLGVTATPLRADGKGLALRADGLFESMVIGPTMRELIQMGFLSDYRIINKPGDIDLSNVSTAAGGDYSPPQLAAARKQSHITGDVVKHYQTFAAGKLGVVFDVDIESATGTAAAFRAAGIPAEVVTSKTSDEARRSILRRFRAREIMVLVNVDLFGEGFDLPAIEVVMMARPTQSYGLYVQQFGRALRIMAGKGLAIIIDHVGNVARHGLPDAYREWSLDRRERRSRSSPSDMIPTRTCTNPECASEFECYLKICPFCKTPVQIADRSTPKHVDGDLQELDPSVLAAMRGEIIRIDSPAIFPSSAPPEVRGAILREHVNRQNVQRELRESIALWGGWQTALGRSDSEGYVRFFHRYGLDVASAMALNASKAAELKARVDADLVKHNVVRMAA